MHPERAVMMQATDYQTKALALATPQPAGTAGTISLEVAAVRDALSVLLETGSSLGSRLTDVSNILQALSDLRVLHTDSLVSPSQGSLQTLLANLIA